METETIRRTLQGFGIELQTRNLLDKNRTGELVHNYANIEAWKQSQSNKTLKPLDSRLPHNYLVSYYTIQKVLNAGLTVFKQESFIHGKKSNIMDGIKPKSANLSTKSELLR